MRLFLKFVVPAVFLALSTGGALAETKKDKPKSSEKKKKDEAPKDAPPKDGASSDKPEKEKNKGKDKEPQKLSFPVPIGHGSKGLKLPSYGPDGKLKMLFNIEVANRLDENNVDMINLQLETYDDEGAPELAIALPTSSFNLSTHMLSTKQEVVITRDDFQLSGHTMEFNIDTREGILGGGVKMIIYNLDTGDEADADKSPDKPDAKPGGLPKVTLPGTDPKPTIKVLKPQSTPPKETKPSE